uniref:Uncharacterized protein n=1 Tax=Mycena chlorophos TaxID=658473 RepID=A0ABQ0LQN5_MYCCL|nr:predicted protein [Mycena chlorophos]
MAMASRQHCERSPPSTAQILARRAPHLFTESASWGTPSVQQHQLTVRRSCGVYPGQRRNGVSPLNPSSSSSPVAPHVHHTQRLNPQRPTITLSRIPIPIPHFPHDPPPKRRLYAPVPGLERSWDTIGAKRRRSMRGCVRGRSASWRSWVQVQLAWWTNSACSAPSPANSRCGRTADAKANAARVAVAG